MLAATISSHADSLARGNAAFVRGDYNKAARELVPLAERGNPRAQAMLGFMYATGQGVPQNYNAASYWYRLSAEQGDTTAQYLLGLAYDKGQGVPLDEVAAYKWLNLAASRAPKRVRDDYRAAAQCGGIEDEPRSDCRGAMVCRAMAGGFPVLIDVEPVASSASGSSAEASRSRLPARNTDRTAGGCSTEADDAARNGAARR